MIDFSVPLAGMDRATASISRTASKPAAQPVDTLDLSTEMVALIEAQRNFETNAKVAQAEDQITRSLLKIVG